MKRRYWFAKRYADRVAKLRVPSGFVLVAGFALLARPNAGAMGWGLSLSVCGLLLRGWAAGHLAKNQELARSGPYAWIRNPLYVGTLLVAAGLVVSTARWELAVLFGLVFLLIYLPVIELEEQHLRSLFPDYAGYAERVPVLLPTRRPLVSERIFRWSLYRKNEEYQALVGWVLGYLYLAWRCWGR